MEHIENIFTPDAATDEPAVIPSTPRANEPEHPPAWLYFQGVADGIRKCGGIVPADVLKQAGLGPEFNNPAEGDLLAFETVEVRARHDGWTPQKQRQFVEALADSGIVRRAAAQVGMSEQSVSNLRRRTDARAFDAACEAALRLGAQRLRSIAWERAIEGTLKGHYYHGELKSEERVYDNRLLIYLLGRTKHLDEPSPRSARVLKNWDGWMDAIEQELPAPPSGMKIRLDGNESWKRDGEWVTGFPPPEDFDGFESGAWGSPDYYRQLSAAERAVIEANEAAYAAAQLAAEAERRDIYFGFAEAEDTSSMQASTYQTSEASEADEEVTPLPGREGPGVGAAEALGGAEAARFEERLASLARTPQSPPSRGGEERPHRRPSVTLP